MTVSLKQVESPANRRALFFSGFSNRDETAYCLGEEG